jgi:Bromodomain
MQCKGGVVIVCVYMGGGSFALIFCPLVFPVSSHLFVSLCSVVLSLSHTHKHSLGTAAAPLTHTTGLVDYPSVIKVPMDLGTIKKKIKDKKYTNIYQCAEDVRLVWRNCSTCDS